LSLLLAAGSNSSSLSDVEPGLLGFLVVAGLGVALVFLLRSMNKQFRKIGPGPEETEDTVAATADEARAGGETAAAAPDGSTARDETTAQDGPAAQAGSTVQDAPGKSAGQDAGTTAP
jgi:hypothetical protein